MAKRATASKSQLKPDCKYNSRMAGKFINCLMLKGKKSIAQQIFYDAMDIIAEKEKSLSKAVPSSWVARKVRMGEVIMKNSIR